MAESCRQGSLRAWFRAIVIGMAVADRWMVDRPLTRPLYSTVLQADPAVEPATENWPSSYLALAQACAAGYALPEASWKLPGSSHQEPWPALLLVATPVLLLNVNRYGHRRRVMQSWGHDLGLSATTLAALDQYFQSLCWGLAGSPALFPVSSALGRSDLGAPKGEPHHLATALTPEINPLAPLQRLVQTAQGQFVLALDLAQAQGWSSPMISLVGVLALVMAGPAGLPLALSHRYGGTAALGERWLNWDVTQLEHLADTLYWRWAGVRSFTVARGGTAYNG